VGNLIKRVKRIEGVKVGRDVKDVKVIKVFMMKRGEFNTKAWWIRR
jgi:hypothetical protein